MIIAISGKPGSGKSTVANIISDNLKLNNYSFGDLRGSMALDMGITIDDLNKVGEKDEFTDKEADEYQEKLGKEKDNFVTMQLKNDSNLSKYRFTVDSKKDLVGFTPFSTYEFIVDGQRQYRVMTQFITIKYEYQGNEEAYNPSWAQSSR